MKNLTKLFALIILINLFSCSDEPIGDSSVSAAEVIRVDSELYRMLELIVEDEPNGVVACVDFIYSFNINVYNSNLELVNFETIHNDSEFILFLDSITDEFSIGLSYPITSLLSNGDQLIIKNNEELQENLEYCLDEEVLEYCNSLLEDCVWKVTHLDGGNNDFEGAYFNVSNLGVVWFYFNEEIYSGSWISLFIENELNLNINLNDQNIVGNSWNFNWKVTIQDENHMELVNNEKTFLLEKECFSPCKQLIFEECEFEPEGGISRFNLSSYIACFLPFTDIVDLSNITISFYEKFEDAENGENAISSTNYINIENPQSIYVRFEESDTGEIVEILTIYIAAVSCRN